jgi:hypothetical protein
MFGWQEVLALLNFLWELWQRVDNALVMIAIVGGGFYLDRVVIPRLRGERQDLEDSVDTLEEHVKALKEALDQGSDDNWEQIRGMWADMRERIEHAIEEIDDGRKRRKYSSMPRYSYQKIIDNVQRDLGLSRDVAYALQQMNAWFLSLRRSKIATQEQVNGIWGYYQIADKVLPKIPTGAG